MTYFTPTQVNCETLLFYDIFWLFGLALIFGIILCLFFITRWKVTEKSNVKKKVSYMLLCNKKTRVIVYLIMQLKLNRSLSTF